MASLLKDTSAVGISQVGSTITFLVAGILTARYLGPAGKGAVALALGTGMLVGDLLCMGFDRSAAYFVASGKLSTSKVLGSWLLTILFGLTLAYGAIYPILLHYGGDSLFKGISDELLVAGSFICPIYLCRSTINSILSGHRQFLRQTSHNICIFVGSISSAVLALMVLKYQSLGYIVCHIVFAVGSLLCGIGIASRVISYKPSIDFSAWRQMFSYGARSALWQLFYIVDLRLDVYVVNYFVGPSIVGIYTVAASVVRMLLMLATTLSAVLFPRVAGFSKDKSDALTAVICRNALWVTAIAGVVLALVSRPLISFVFGEEFASASIAVAWLIPGVVGQTVGRICLTDCSARGYPGKATITSACTATLTIIFDLLLIPRYGMVGAAIASSISYSASGILGMFWHLRISGNSLSAILVPRISDMVLYTHAAVRVKQLLIAKVSKRK